MCTRARVRLQPRWPSLPPAAQGAQRAQEPQGGADSDVRLLHALHIPALQVRLTPRLRAVQGAASRENTVRLLFDYYLTTI
jgi:hypothetical protein